MQALSQLSYGPMYRIVTGDVAPHRLPVLEQSLHGRVECLGHLVLRRDPYEGLGNLTTLEDQNGRDALDIPGDGDLLVVVDVHLANLGVVDIKN